MKKITFDIKYCFRNIMCETYMYNRYMPKSIRNCAYATQYERKFEDNKPEHENTIIVYADGRNQNKVSFNMCAITGTT